VVDFKPLVKFMKDGIERYGLWRVTAAALLTIVCWRVPEIIAAIRWW